MAYAHITEFDVGDDRSTSNYDAAGQRLYDQGQPEGAIHHSAGFDANGVFRMYEVWESREHRERFVKDRLEPLLAEGPVDPSRTNPPDREYGYDLHALVQAG
jgi:hypothetical protein